MTAELRSYLYAPPRSAGYAVASLPAKAPHTRRMYEIDFTALLRQLGQMAIFRVLVAATEPLHATFISVGGPVVTVRVSGGLAVPPYGQVCVALLFSDGCREDVALAQPMSACLPDIPEADEPGGTGPPPTADGTSTTDSTTITADAG